MTLSNVSNVLSPYQVASDILCMNAFSLTMNILLQEHYSKTVVNFRFLITEFVIVHYIINF